MFYKLSNRANREQIEVEFDAFFQFPNIYRPRTVIDGLDESTISIITSESPQRITPSIWGILPSTFSDDWQVFQKYMNTLNIPSQDIDSEIWYAEAFRKRRCLILVTGYYSCFITHGELFPFCHGHFSGRPFCLAGIYNQLDDGFFTATPITVKANHAIQQTHNLSDRMPMSIPKNWRKRWLDPELSLNEVRSMLKTPLYNEFRAIPVSKRIFDIDVLDSTAQLTIVNDDLAMPLILKHLLSDFQINVADT